ncbi:uncharacterized protein [Amphiura filiformis]|uniref:uncharacterized protein n=1 Tax=Amphiura filiformis TaxID=82378 RepID=UPI003B22005B
MMMAMEGRTGHFITVVLLTCLFFAPCKSQSAIARLSSSAGGGLLACSYRGTLMLHGGDLVIDECTTCTCDNSTVKCDIKSCAPTFCDEPLVDPNICCDLCPYYVPVWQIIPDTLDIIFESAINDLVINLIVKVNDKGQGVEGEGLWKVGVWGSANNDGSGKRIGYNKQVLTETQAAHRVTRPPFFGGFEFTIPGIEYAFNGFNTTCSQMAYLCMEFGKRDNPYPIYPQLPFDVLGVESEYDNSPNPRHLIGCSPFIDCIGNTSSINNGSTCSYKDKLIEHGDEAIVECVTCSCDNANLICEDLICPRALCDDPIPYPSVCCDLCPYYVPVHNINIRSTLPVIIENAINDFSFNLRVRLNRKGQGVEGEGLWKVSVWGSSFRDGSGERFGYVEQVLTQEQSGTDLVRYRYRSFEFTIEDILYTLNGTNATCAQLIHLCVAFGKGDAPVLTYPDLSFDVEGVESYIDSSPNPDHLLVCSPFPNCIARTPDGNGLLPCYFRGTRILHGGELVIDECTTCYCDNSTVKCDIKSCQPTFCDEPIVDPALCCDLCPYYVPVWKVTPRTLATIFTNVVNDLVVDLNLKINDQGQTVEGTGLWKIGMWASANDDGSGERKGYKEQVLSEKQAAIPAVRPPFFGGFEVTFPDIEYALDGSKATCTQMAYLCAEFGKGDAPVPIYPQSPFDVEGVESETHGAPNPQHLIGCSPFENCIGNVCLGQQKDSKYGLLTWPTVSPGEAAFSLETCPGNTSLHGLPIAFRQCKLNDMGVAKWKHVKYLGCSENTTNSGLTDSDIEAVARKLDHFTNNIKMVDKNDITAVAWMVQNIASAESPSSEVLNSISKAVNKLVDSVHPSLNFTFAVAPSTSEIVQGLEKQVKTTLAQQDEIKLVLPSLVIMGVGVNNNIVNPVQLSVFETTTGNESVSFVDATVTQQKNEPIDQTSGSPAVSLRIPVGVIPPEQGKAGFFAYKDDFLFQSNWLMSEMLKVDGPVIGTTLVASNLRQPVLIKIKSRLGGNPTNNDVPPKCVFWDFQLENGVGDWSEEGCQYVETKDNVIKCRCYHMSTFAVLQDVSHLFPAGPEASMAVMSSGTKAAIAVTLITVGITFLILVGFRQLRNSKEYHTFSNFCLATFILYLVFASGIDAAPNSIGCILVAALLDYFTLVPLLWLAVEIRYATNEGAPSKALVKAYALSWGLPLVVVGLALAISTNDYRNPEGCAVTVSPALFYGAVIPVVVIVLHNLVAFVFALRFLNNRSYNVESEDETAEDDSYIKVRKVSQRLYAAMAVFSMFTLSVCLGYLHLAEPQTTAIVAVFSISVVLTGLVTFGMFCLYLEDVRHAIVPKKYKRQVPEMEAPLHFENKYPSVGEQEDAVEKVDNQN